MPNRCMNQYLKKHHHVYNGHIDFLVMIIELLSSIYRNPNYKFNSFKIGFWIIKDKSYNKDGQTLD